MKTISKVAIISLLMAGPAHAEILTVLDGNGNYAGEVVTGNNSAYALDANGNFAGSIYGAGSPSAARSVDSDLGLDKSIIGEKPLLK